MISSTARAITIEMSFRRLGNSQLNQVNPPRLVNIEATKVTAKTKCDCFSDLLYYS